MRRHAAIIAIAIAVCGALLAFFRLPQPLDLKLLDAQFGWLRATRALPVARDVVVVGIDEETAKGFPEPVTLWHAHLGRFLSALAAAKPAALGVDIILPERSYDAVVPGSDKKLLKGLLDARLTFPVVLGQTVDPAGQPRPVHPLYLKIAGAAGFALFPVDRDGAVRRFDERLGDGGQAVATLAGELARKLGAQAGAGYIDFRSGAPFSYVPMHQVLKWADANDRQALEGAFQGKPVLLGMVLPFEDRLRAPVPLAAWEPGASSVPGVLLHAQALRNLLNGGLVREVPAALVAALCAALAALWFLSGGAALVAAVLAAALLLLGGAAVVLLAAGWYFPAVAPALTAAVALGGRHGYDTLLKLRERARLRGTFGGYVSPQVMEEILAGRIHPEMDGESRDVCVLFSDIRNYTTRSEAMTPGEIVRFLNRYFERAVALIHDHGGTVVSFMGDGIMAVFGAPKPGDDACRAAFEASRAMLRYVEELNAEFHAEGIEPIAIGIGLNAGEAVIGNVGSSTRHDYTVIGDVTNVASRLESLTKAAGYRIVCSAVVAQRLGRQDGLVPLGALEVKGHTPVEAYGYDRI